MVVPAKTEGCTPHITTLQLEDPNTGPSVRVLASSQANQSTEVPQTDSAVGMLPTDIDNIQRAQREDVENWCRACIECQRAETETRKPKAMLQVSRVGAPMQKIGIDILGPLTQTSRVNRYVLVISDYFTNWSEAYTMKNVEAVTVADLLVKKFICRFVIPRQLHSGHGKQFESEVFQQICLLFDIDKTRATVFHPLSKQWTLQAYAPQYIDRSFFPQVRVTGIKSCHF